MSAPVARRALASRLQGCVLTGVVIAGGMLLVWGAAFNLALTTDDGAASILRPEARLTGRLPLPVGGRRVLVFEAAIQPALTAAAGSDGAFPMELDFEPAPAGLDVTVELGPPGDPLARVAERRLEAGGDVRWQLPCRSGDPCRQRIRITLRRGSATDVPAAIDWRLVTTVRVALSQSGPFADDSVTLTLVEELG